MEKKKIRIIAFGSDDDVMGDLSCIEKFQEYGEENNE